MNRGYRAAVLAIVSILAVVALQGRAMAGDAGGPGSIPSLSCFYECKPGPVVDGKPTWREITTLMMGNSGGSEVFATTNGLGPGAAISANVRIYDGNTDLVAETSTLLFANDLDELNICATIRNAGRVRPCVPNSGECQIDEDCCDGSCLNDTCVINAATQGGAPMAGPVPEAGLIRIDFMDGRARATTSAGATVSGGGDCIPDYDGPCQGMGPCCNRSSECIGINGTSVCEPVVRLASNSVHVWVKNLLGRFFVERDEPFEGRVTGIAKTRCQTGPPSNYYDTNGLSVRPVLVENTADEPNGGPIGPCGGDPIFPECNGECPPGYFCQNDPPVATTSAPGTGSCLCFPRFDPSYPCGGDPDFPTCEGECEPGDICRPTGPAATASGGDLNECRCFDDED